MSTAEDDFTAFVGQAWPRLFRTAYALTLDVQAADELLQASLVKVFVHWRKVERAESPEAYVRRILVNQAASSWRSRNRRPEVLSAEPWEHQPGRGFEQELTDRDELWRGIRQLPVRQRAVVFLRYFEGLSEAEIAAVLGIAPGTVKSQASAALAKLRRCLTTEDLEELA